MSRAPPRARAPARVQAPVRVQEVEPRLVELVRGSYECATNGTSIFGLCAILRRWPRRWAALLRACLPEDAPVARDATLGEFLRGGAVGLLLPRDRWDQNLKRRRASANALASWFGDIPLDSLDEPALEKLRTRYFQKLKEHSPDGLSRDMTLLRQVVRAGQIAIGVEPVAARWETPRPAAKKAGRGAPHALRDIALLLEALDREPDVRAIVGLIVGSRLWEAEVLGLALTDIDLKHRIVAVRGRRTRGWPSGSADRIVPIAAWAVPLLSAWLRARGRSAWQPIFPNRNDPRRPRTSATRAVVGAARRAELGSGGGSRAPWTLSALRRDGQAVARAAGLPRAAVRGTVGPPDDPAKAAKVQNAVYQASKKLADDWTCLVEPPVKRARLSRAVPRRAPKGTPAARSETAPRDTAASGRARTSWPLPESCMPKPVGEGEKVWFPEDSFDPAPDGSLVPRAHAAPPVAQPVRSADPGEEAIPDLPAVRGAASVVNAGTSVPPEPVDLVLPPPPPLPKIVYVPVRDKAAETDAFVGGVLGGGAAGFLLGLNRGKKQAQK